MRRRTQFTIFFGTFETLSLVMHYYIFSHLFFLLDIHRDLWFWVFIVVSSFLWFLSMAITWISNNGPARVFYAAASVWLGLLFMFLFILIAYDILRLSFDLDTSGAGPVIVAVAAGTVIFGLMNARWLRVREVEVPSKKLEGELRVVHITDVHIGALYRTSYLRKIVERTNELMPDMVLITGDLADGFGEYDEGTFAPLDDIEAPIYFTTGNHEGFSEVDIPGLLAGTKVRVLRDEMVKEGNVQIVGVGDHRDRNRVAQVLDDVRLDPCHYSILMYHRPVGLDDARERGVDLMLTGHTHAGQFYPFNLLVRAIWKKVKGLYDLGGMYLYAGSGTGTWGPPMRVGTSSEIALIKVNGRPEMEPSVC